MDRRVVQDLAILWTFGLSVLLCAVWWTAAFQGGTTTVHVDAYGEMFLEFLVWLVVSPVIAVGLGEYLRGGRSGA